MLEMTEQMTYSHYTLSGTVAGVRFEVKNLCHLAFVDILGLDGKTYEVNMPYTSGAFFQLEGMVGAGVSLRVEGYLVNGRERYALLEIL